MSMALEDNTVILPLTKGQVALVDVEYARIVERYKWHSGHGYAIRTDCFSRPHKNVRMHRYLWEAINGPIPEGMEIDHISGNRSDNRLENLRLVTRRENGQNRSDRRNGTTASKYVGVFWHRQNRKWRAMIRVNGVHHDLGCFDFEELAGEAYQKALQELVLSKEAV